MEREFIDFLTDEGGEGATLGDQFREPLALFLSNVDAEHPNEAGVITSVRFSNVDAAQIYYGDIILPFANNPNGNEGIDSQTIAGGIISVDVNTYINSPCIDRGTILLPVAHQPRNGQNWHPGLLREIRAITNIEFPHELETVWNMVGGELYYPSILAANYNVEGVKNTLGYIVGANVIYDSTVDVPRVNQGFVEIPVARYISDVDFRENAGVIVGISKDSSIDSPYINEGHIFIPSGSGGLPGIWSQEETLSGASGVEPALPSGYNVNWAAVQQQTANPPGGVECGDLTFQVNVGTYYRQIALKMYASVSDAGFLRFFFIQS